MLSESGPTPEGCAPVPPVHPSAEHGGHAPPGGVFGGGPAVIGHRGLGCGVVAGHPENTLGSFAAAAALGAPWVEVDVRRTADDVLVVAHDPQYLDGTYIADLSGAQTDQRGTLRLADLLDELPAEVGVDFDLKSTMDDCLRLASGTTAGLLGPVVADEEARRPVVVSSFDPAALYQLRCGAPRVPLAWLTWYRFPLEAAVAGCGHLDVEVLGVHVGSLSRDARVRGLGIAEGVGVDVPAVERAVSLVHGCGRELMVWCPDPARAQLLVDAGADAVVVDEMPQALDALRPAA
jgi:glycerophosphoryl diester phosphodiesterase